MCSKHFNVAKPNTFFTFQSISNRVGIYFAKKKSSALKHFSDNADNERAEFELKIIGEKMLD